MYSERCDKYYNLTLVEERQGHPGWGKGEFSLDPRYTGPSEIPLPKAP
jgi:hypothetical protein